MNMRAIQLIAPGIENLRQVLLPMPIADSSDVLIRMAAASLNARDLAVVAGRIPNLRMPLIPLSDGTGQVVEVGRKVTRFRIGDRVCPMFYPRWISGDATRYGMELSLGGSASGCLSEYFVADEQSLALAPEHLSDVAAASLCCSGITAWTALEDTGLRPGQTVLLQGTGGVSTFGLQFAKLLGARTIVISSNAHKLEKAMELGADLVINRSEQPDWASAVLDATSGTGADVVLEVGGSETLAASIRALAIGGNIAVIGVLGGTVAQLSLMDLLRKMANIHSVAVGSRRSFESMCAALSLHRLQPVVSCLYSECEIVEAFRAFQSAQHVGKLGLRLFNA